MQLSNRVSAAAVRPPGRVTAVLGPTNTGKTHYAVEQMVTYQSGVIGFPLRLLARENYDRLVALKGAHAVALVTGEEKIVPPQARYFSCTVESMPVERMYDFLAVDEIQLCADPDRGHIFTDRLLRARGREQTMFMGAETARSLLEALIPGIDIVTRPRLSMLTYKGYKKLTRLPKRSAVVAFSVEDVYAIAELMRRQRGGTAVVLGALSPRTRNKQVEMYQSGEVDFLVATDAIGMGLNMDIHHVALAAARKYDGQVIRPLDRAEMAQIAGRAGRHLRDGTFGVTGRVSELDPETVEAIETHSFASLPSFFWRNSFLDFGSPKDLLDSLDRFSGTALLLKGRPADDYRALTHVMERDDVMARADGEEAVKLLWDVCQIPDFRQTLTENHQDLVADIYVTLRDRGAIPADRIRQQLERLDKTEGDVDALMARIAHIRTWTYITHKSEWLKDAGEWADRAKAIEDRLSDALHEGLTRRFVDRRSAVLMRAIEEGGTLLAGVRADGEVVVEGHKVGNLDGFRFVPDGDASGSDFKAVMAAARNALKPEIKRRLTNMLNAEAKQFRLNDAGQILFQPDATNPLPGQPIAHVRKGHELLQPVVEVADSSLLQDQDKAAVAEKLKEWLKTHVATVLEPLVPLRDEQGLDGTARGIAFQLYEALGILPRADLEDLIGGLDEAGRASLRARKVRLGPVLVFLPALNKPAAIRLRALLWSLWHEREIPAQVPPDGVTSISVVDFTVDQGYYRAIGYPVYGPRAIRVDMLDRLIGEIYDSAKDGQFRAAHKMAEWLGCPIPDLYAVLEAMGHRKIEDPADAKPAEAAPAVEAAAEATPEAAAETPANETPAENAAEAAPAAAPAPAVKPALALFQLRKGRAYSVRKPREDRADAPRWKKEDRPAKGDRGKADHGKTDHGKGGRKDKGKDARPRDRKHGDRKDRGDREERVISATAQARPEDSPFAMLQNLKVKGKDG